VLVRRRAEQAPLASTFVGVLEPYEGESNLAKIRRLELQDARGEPCSDGDVGIEIQLAEGRRDVLISRNVERESDSRATTLFEKETGARFEGDLCLVRLGATTRPERVLICRGKSLRIGKLVVQASNSRASFEIDLSNKAAPVVAGAADAVGLIEITGVKIWPK
jgi:hypothetical protein